MDSADIVREVRAHKTSKLLCTVLAVVYSGLRLNNLLSAHRSGLEKVPCAYTCIPYLSDMQLREMTSQAKSLMTTTLTISG